jgi:hypothetical protein
MSFCDRLAIPEELIRADDREDTSGRASSFEEDLVTLRDFSFIGETADTQMWEMHRLVQDATQAWLEDHRRLSGAYS